VRDELKFGQDKVYTPAPTRLATIGLEAPRPGDNFGFPGSPNVEGDLIQAMLTNPHLKIEVENGLYDLATPFYATEYTMEHLGLPDKLQKNIHLQYYDAGHMNVFAGRRSRQAQIHIAALSRALPSSNRTNQLGWREDNFPLAAAATAFRDRGCTFLDPPALRTVILKKNGIPSLRWPSVWLRVPIEELQKSDLLPHSRLAPLLGPRKDTNLLWHYDAYYASADHSFAGAGAFFGARRAAHHSHAQLSPRC